MIYINDYASISTLGSESEIIRENLCGSVTNLLEKRDDLLLNGLSSYFGTIKGDFPDVSSYKAHKSRNNALTLYVLLSLKDKILEAIDKYGSERIGIVMGTSTSGLSDTELEMKNFLDTSTHSLEYSYSRQEFGDLSAFIRDYFNLKGPAYTISTACSSSARALISAKRLLEADMADMVIAGGTDTLCSIPVNGFNSMGVLSYERTIPFNENRSGINIGEASGIMLLSKEKAPLQLKGFGESSDAYHISSPHPEGKGAIASMKMALDNAGLKACDIGYINLHGTGTRLNDSMESKAVASVFGDKTPSSSTKYMTGHTLGAAGVLESIILCELLQSDGKLPKQDVSSDRIDPMLEKCGLILEDTCNQKDFMMSNSFAFGGNNASVIIGRSYE